MGIDLLPLILLTVFIFGAKPVKARGELNTNYLSLETGNCLRGFFALTVVLHHISIRTESGLLLRLFAFAGLPAVSVFFFLSGYGLQKSYMKHEDYKKHFLKRRLSKIIIPYIFVTLLFWGVYALGQKPYSFKDVVYAFLQGNPIVLFSWYIVSISSFYIFYWLFMLICKRNYNLMLLYASIWYILYIIVCTKLGYGEWWYNASHPLIFGMFWAIYEPKILPTIKKYYRVILCFVTFGFGFLSICRGIINDWLVSLIFAMGSIVFFVFLLILFTAKVKIGNPFMNYLGNISLEIYLVQGLFMVGTRSDVVFINNDFIWGVIVFFGSILLGALLHKIFTIKPLSKTTCKT